MKRRIQFFLVFAFLMGVMNGVFAQNYLDIPPDPNFSKDYLNSIIFGDTTATGGRFPDRVYRLEIGGIYYFNNTIKTDGWDLKIVADGTATPEFSKAIILLGKNDQGQKPARFGEVDGDVLFKNIYFAGVTDDDKQLNDLVRVFKDDAIMEMENCYVEWVKLHVFRSFGTNATLHIKDSYFNNISGTGGPFNGKVANFDDNPVNEITMQNNTMINIQGIMFKIRFNTVNKFVFDHNTVVNTIKWPFHFEYWTDGEITNNIFFNASSYGENAIDASNQDLGQQQFGIVNLFDVPDSLLAQAGLADSSERKMVVKNNQFFFDQDVKDYIATWFAVDSASGGLVVEEPWMNPRTQSWFDDDAAYPLLDGEDPIIEDVGFVEYPTADSMIVKMDQWRTDGLKTTWFWVDDDGDKVGNATDRPYDLTYSTSSVSYTAAEGGFPLGDLNWYPDKKAEWEDFISGFESEPSTQVPANFELSQNYPNPFNPTTEIEFRLRKAGQVKLAVYNTLGQKVVTLVDAKRTAGTYSVKWDGRNDNGNPVTTGIYFYKLELGANSITKKMLLAK